ncbi:DUF1798 family protein [Salinicoccus bachuensis]|uniref:DUF1798 family protein n=1 Tax=Salinicoccus bachuensis TaxID=3136731 RepID=A0ABZ3CE56_9STAP
MSRKASFESLRALLDEVDRRYDKARSGYEFDFASEVEPFLEENKELVDAIGEIGTDFRFNPPTREKVVEEFMELLMACHAGRFSLKLYREKYKFINMWLSHAHREGLFG